MARVEPESSEVNARILYWGIEGAGKRTNLRGVYAKLRPDHRGEMREVPTRLDPSIAYTVLPIELGEVASVRTRIELVAVPGSPEQAPMRKTLLDQVDGVVLVIDADPRRTPENAAMLEELRKGLADYARRLEDLPLVVQYNKRDLCDDYGIDELHRRLGLGGASGVRDPPPRLSSRSTRITFFEIVESAWSRPVPSVATASNTVAPASPSRRCSSSAL